MSTLITIIEGDTSIQSKLCAGSLTEPHNRQMRKNLCTFIIRTSSTLGRALNMRRSSQSGKANDNLTSINSPQTSSKVGGRWYLQSWNLPHLLRTSWSCDLWTHWWRTAGGNSKCIGESYTNCVSLWEDGQPNENQTGERQTPSDRTAANKPSSGSDRER